MMSLYRLLIQFAVIEGLLRGEIALHESDIDDVIKPQYPAPIGLQKEDWDLIIDDLPVPSLVKFLCVHSDGIISGSFEAF